MERGRTLNLGDTGVQEIALNPSMSLSFENGPLSLSLGGEYSFLGLLGDPSSVPGPGRSAQLGGVEAQAALELSPAFLVGASFGGAFSSAYLYMLPFSLWTSFALGEYAMVNAQGGLATDQVSLASQWRINPYLDIGALLPEDSRWFGALESDLYPLPDWTVRLGALWAMSYQGGRIKPLAPPAGSSRMLYSYTSEMYRSLESRVSLRKRFGQGLIGLGWNADWFDLPTAEKPHRFFAELEYRELQERYGGSLMIAAASDGVGLDTPKIDAQAFLRFGSGLRLIAEFFDIAMAFKGTEGRVRYRPYVADGFQASLGMQFSF
jgi:hypothetical protein